MKTIEEVIVIYLRYNGFQTVVDFDNQCCYSYDADTHTFLYKPINDDPDLPWLYHDNLNKVYHDLLEYGTDYNL